LYTAKHLIQRVEELHDQPKTEPAPFVQQLRFRCSEIDRITLLGDGIYLKPQVF